MIFAVFLLLFLTVALSSKDTELILEETGETWSHYSQGKKGCYHPSKRRADNYLSTLTNEETGNTAWPIIFQPLCPSIHMLGNFLGTYLNEASCAAIIGAHFLAPKLFVDPFKAATVQMNISMEHIAFYDALPSVVIHENILSVEKVRNNFEQYCQCYKYCWADETTPWLQNIPWSKKVLLTAINAYLSASNEYPATVVEPVFANSSLAKELPTGGPTANVATTTGTGTGAPLIPDVAIHYRCGDNIHYSKYGYGLLPFFTIARLIPSNAKYIYILTEPVKENAACCQPIIDRLVAYISTRFPYAQVALIRGEDALLDFTRLALANTTVCSASTFCFYAGLASNGSAVYFPNTELITKPPSKQMIQSNQNKYQSQHPSQLTGQSVYGDHFMWIEDTSLLVSILEQYRPWQLVFYALEGTSMTVADIEAQNVKAKRGRETYHVSNGVLHSFPDGSTFEALGFDWGDIWEISSELIEGMPKGDDMKV